MAEIWFSSDHHFHHENIIRYANRPFSHASEMNDFMIDQHNKFVRPSDHWYCLGDVTMMRDNKGFGLNVLRGMNGHKRLILGNHDHYAMKFYLEHFEKVMAMNVIDNMRFIHIPIHPTSFGGVKATIHGHIHDQDSPPPVMYVDKNQKLVIKPYINICVERTKYRPITLGEIKVLVKEAIDGGSDPTEAV